MTSINDKNWIPQKVHWQFVARKLLDLRFTNTRRVWTLLGKISGPIWYIVGCMWFGLWNILSHCYRNVPLGDQWIPGGHFHGAVNTSTIGTSPFEKLFHTFLQSRSITFLMPEWPPVAFIPGLPSERLWDSQSKLLSKRMNKITLCNVCVCLCPNI